MRNTFNTKNLFKNANILWRSKRNESLKILMKLYSMNIS